MKQHDGGKGPSALRLGEITPQDGTARPGGDERRGLIGAGSARKERQQREGGGGAEATPSREPDAEAGKPLLMASSRCQRLFLQGFLRRLLDPFEA